VFSPARRDQVAVIAGLAVITATAWVYTVRQADQMSMSSGMGGRSMMMTMHAMLMTQPWTSSEFGLRLAMWVVMMVAMMVPTAAPMTLVYAAVARKAAAQHSPLPPTFVFVAGYVTIWGLFGILATLAQRGLDAATLLSPTMASNSTVFGGAVLVGAGIYQLTPLKHACLKHCRAPAHFLSRYWRRGTIGAFRMGLRLGAYCLACCWILMALLFVGGVMNLLWIAAIAGFVLLEKTLPFGERGSRIAGATAIGAGILSMAV
jgi:predicted metal-binding membrane protein